MRAASLFVFLVATLTSLPSSAQNTIVVVSHDDTSPTTVDPLVWGEANVRANGRIDVNENNLRGSDGIGSIEMGTTNPPIVSGQDKADFEIFFTDTDLILGDLDALLFDWYRDSSSTVPAHFAPVLRIYFETASGDQGLLVWEAIYQTQYGGAVPTDQWVSEDLLPGRFWQRAFGPGRTIDRYDLTLADWIASGAVSDGVDTGWDIDADTRVLGVNVGFGSGWGGNDFLAYVDLVTLAFSGASTTWDFGSLATLGLCPLVPAEGCIEAAAGKSKLLLKQPRNKDHKDRFVFSWRSERGTDPGDLGAPDVDDELQLCLYEDGDLLYTNALGPGEGWRQRGSSWQWKAADGDDTGFRAAKFKLKEGRRSVIQVKGKGRDLAVPRPDPNPSTDTQLQLQSTTGDCWSSAFEAPRRDGGDRFLYR